ncbi:hypothetical protein NQ315_012937 [Exocentrus adspersus]|uniref:Uncharacterized protein n=1 Tax=Exocentrus adspersus TaxID=1586481 RepID=A0AAV8VG50_9CUCU|nr:hypothetical protein NQ315_014419 [Exocentrus adspersus]KAJ8913966.1 hypothetical protein NQ315_008957 [Exocentrus adspersus]KAJ8917019.1 hypothetical protein NQ315_012937 [Exocentrus adspersus]
MYNSLGPTAWPPRSPDLTPMDYFLWGTVKSDVYSYAATTQEDMRITPAMFDNVRHSFIRKIISCIAQNGQHFEQLLH